MQLSAELKGLLEDVYAFLKDLDSAALQINLRRKGESLKARLEEVVEATSSAPDEEVYDEAEADTTLSPPQLPKPRTDTLSPTSTLSSSFKGSLVRRKSPSSTRVSEESEIPDIAASVIVKEATIHGFLEKKRPDNATLFKNFYQKRYCVIHNGIFYYYDKETDKKMKGAFYLKDYEARPASAKHPSKKEGAFELVAPAQRSYQFVAKDFDQMTEWIVAVSEWSSMKHPPISSLTRPASVIEKGHATHSNQGSDSGSISAHAADNSVEEETYDEAGEDSNKLSPSANPPYQDNDDGMDFYDEGETLPPPAVEEEDNATAADNSEEIYDELGDGDPQIEEEIYDEGEADDSNERAQPVLPSRPRPQIGGDGVKQSRPLPPAPSDRAEISARYDDYENQYYGVCDCTTDVGHELSFSQGDVIHVVSRQHAASGWWTAILNGKVGLVPSSYLIPAFQLYC